MPYLRLLLSSAKEFNYYVDMDPSYFYVICNSSSFNMNVLSSALQQFSLPIQLLELSTTQQLPESLLVVRPDAVVAIVTNDVHELVDYFANMY